MQKGTAYDAFKNKLEYVSNPPPPPKVAQATFQKCH